MHSESKILVNIMPINKNKIPKAGNDTRQLLPTTTPKSRNPPLTFSIFTVGAGHCWLFPEQTSSGSFTLSFILSLQQNSDL